MTRKEKIIDFCSRVNVLNPSITETSPEYIYTDALVKDDFLLDVLLKVDFRHPIVH